MSTLTIPVTLVAGTNENVNDVVTNFNAIASWANGNVGSTNIATSGVATTNIAPLAVTDAKIASANNSVYRTVAQGSGGIAGSVANATYFHNPGASWTLSSADIPNMTTIYVAAADYTVGSLTAKFRLRANVLTNATAPGCNFTFGLYPISASAGGAGALTYTFGTVTSGSTALHTAPAATAQLTANSGDFSLPSDGHYAIGVVLSGTGTAANSRQACTWALQMRSV